MVGRRIEGHAAEIRGDKVTREEKPNRRRGKHKGQVIAAEGSVEVEITKQHPASEPSETRPPAGTVLKADRATVNARWSGKVSPDEGGGKRRRVRVDRGFDAILYSYRSRRSGRRAPTPSCSRSSQDYVANAAGSATKGYPLRARSLGMRIHRLRKHERIVK